MSSTPFFSIIVCTGREDYPFTHHPDWHVLGKILEACDGQTFRDFELVIVDLLHEYRSDYIEKVKGGFGFPILHIPDKKSIFRELKLPRICSAKNTGIIFSRGRYLVFSDDGQEWSRDSFENLHKWAEQGVGATCRWHLDKGAGPVNIDSRWVAHGMGGTSASKVVKAEAIGYFGGTLSMVLADTMLRCNGWDEMFDGTRQLEDGDMAQRLGIGGYRVALSGDPLVVEYAMSKWSTDRRIITENPFLKCNGSYWYPQLFGGRRRLFVNVRLLTNEEIRSFTYNRCRMVKDGRCAVSKDACLDKWRWYCNPPPGGDWNDETNRNEHFSYMKKVYQDSRLVFDIKRMRNSVIKEKTDWRKILPL